MVGAICLPLEGCGTLTIAALGDDRADALGKAALLAERVVDDPILRSLMPPSAQAAVDTARDLAVASKRGRGPLRAVFASLRGPGARRLAMALAREQAKRSAATGEVGILPLAILAAKYGPGVARAAHKAYKEKQARKRRKRAAAAAAAARNVEPEQVEPEQVEPEQVEPEQVEPEQVDGGEWITDFDGAP